MSALDTQIGGSHYKNMPIQPMQYSMANELDACQHTIIKYVTRFREKGGVQDLEKAKHVIDMLIEFEQNGVKPATTPNDQMTFDFNAMLIDAPKDSAESASTKETLDFNAMLRDAIEAVEAAEAALAAMPAEPKECSCPACTLRRKLSAMFPDAEIDVTFLSEDTGRTD